MVQNFEDIFIRFDMIHERERRTDGHRMTAIAALMHSIARQKCLTRTNCCCCHPLLQQRLLHCQHVYCKKKKKTCWTILDASVVPTAPRKRGIQHTHGRAIRHNGPRRWCNVSSDWVQKVWFSVVVGERGYYRAAGISTTSTSWHETCRHSSEVIPVMQVFPPPPRRVWKPSWEIDSRSKTMCPKNNARPINFHSHDIPVSRLFISRLILDSAAFRPSTLAYLGKVTSQRARSFFQSSIKLLTSLSESFINDIFINTI